IVGRVMGAELVMPQIALRIYRALHVHQLGSTLGFPAMFLLAAQLHTYRHTGELRQQERVGTNVIRPIAAIAADRLQTDNLYLRFVEVTELANTHSEHFRAV